MNKVSLGQRLRALRDREGLTQVEIAEAITQARLLHNPRAGRLFQSQYALVEQGLSSLYYSDVPALAAKLKVTVDEIYDESLVDVAPVA